MTTAICIVPKRRSKISRRVSSDGSWEDFVRRYTAMHDALEQTDRPIVYSICEWGQSQLWEWAAEVGHLWQTTGDITDNWSSIREIIISIDGRYYTRGLGAHAPSRVVYYLGGRCSELTVDVGIDDEVAAGSVSFAIRADDVVVSESEVRTRHRRIHPKQHRGGR